MTTTLLIIYCLAILLASLAGGSIPLWVRLTHRQMELAVSMVAGLMLGVGVLHLLPHALLVAPGQLDFVFTWVLVGFLALFLIERFFRFHQHETPEDISRGLTQTAEQTPRGDHDAAPAHAGHQPHRPNDLSWGGAAVGLSLHTIINGIALAAAVTVESRGGHVDRLAGLGTFLVIFMHKPFDALTISTLMTIGGWSAGIRHLVNGLFALMIPLGVVLFQFGLATSGDGSRLMAGALAFSAGTFLCIAAADLLPELQFHRHDRLGLSAALVVGLALAWVIGIIETQGHGHQHGHGAAQPAAASGPAEPGHDIHDRHDPAHDHTH